MVTTDYDLPYPARTNETPVFCSVCVFSGDLPGSDSDAAAEAQRAAGFTVFRLPPAVKAALDVEGDDFIEIRRNARSRCSMDAAADLIVEPFGGRVELGMESIAEIWAPDLGAPPPRRDDNVVRLAGRRKSSGG
jgi:hypothetical protein